MHNAFKERRAQRWKAFLTFVILLILYILLGALVNYTVRGLTGPLFLLGMLIFMVAFFYTLSRSWATEVIETSIAVKMYEASKLLELCSGEEEESKLYLGKAVKLVKKAIRILKLLSSTLEEKKSSLFNKEFAEPLIRLEENLETLILPRIAQGKDTQQMIPVLRGLAKLFGEIGKPISLNDIISKNEDLERYEEVKLEGKTIADTLKPIVSSKPAVYLFSLFCGYFSATVILLVACQLLEMNFAETMRANLFGWVSLGLGFTGAIIGLITLKR